MKFKKTLVSIVLVGALSFGLVSKVKAAETQNVNPRESIQNVIEDPNVVEDYNNIYMISGMINGSSVKLTPLYKLAYCTEEFEEVDLSLIPKEYPEKIKELSDSIYTAWFYNDSNNLLRKYTFFAEPIEFPEGTIKLFLFNINVPKNFSKLAIKYKDKIIHRFNKSQNAPTVNIISPAGGEYLDAAHTIKWTGSDPDGDDLLYDIKYSHNNGSNWAPIELEIENTSCLLHANNRAGGEKCLIKVTATDGFNEGEAISNVFSVSNKVPYAYITRPEPNSVFSNDPNISNTEFKGWAYDPEKGELGDPSSFKWTSSIDGFIGKGSSFTYGNLSVGNHTITLDVTDEVGNVGVEKINIGVTDETRPDVSIRNITPRGKRLVEGNLHNYLKAEVHNIIQDALVDISFYDGNPKTNGTLIESYREHAYANYLTDFPARWTNATAGDHDIYVIISNSIPKESDESNNVANAKITVLPKDTTNSK